MANSAESHLRLVAQKEAKGDPVVEEILLWHLRYNWGKGINPRTPRIDPPHKINGVKFWCVGHNASYDFYLGTDGNGKKFRRSVGEGDELDEEGFSRIVEHVEEVADFHGYYGHF